MLIKHTKKDKTMKNHDNPKIVEDIADRKKRIDLAKKLKKRLEKIASRKKNPVSLNELCRRHNLQASSVSRGLNLTEFLPTMKTLERLDTALKSEDG